MQIRAFLRQQLDRDPLEHGRLFVGACAAVCAGYFLYMAGLYVGLPPQDLARESGFVLTVLNPIVVFFALPVGFALAVFAYGLSLFLPRHALRDAWLTTCIGVWTASALAGFAWGPRSLALVPGFALALASLTWILFRARARA